MKQHLIIHFSTGHTVDRGVHDVVQSLLWKQVMSKFCPDYVGNVSDFYASQTLYPGQRVQTAGCAQVNDLHPRLHYSLNCASLETTCKLILTQQATGNLSKGQTSMSTWMCPCCTHQLDCECKHWGREALACSRAEWRGMLQLLEHEAYSCSAACTNITVCYLLLRLCFKTTD